MKDPWDKPYIWRALNGFVLDWTISHEIPQKVLDTTLAPPPINRFRGDAYTKLTDISTKPVVMRYSGEHGEFRWKLTDTFVNNRYLQLGVWPD